LNLRSIFEDKKGDFWFGLPKGEIGRFRPGSASGGSQWELFSVDEGLAKGYGPRIVQTRDGSIWTMSKSGSSGMNRFNGQRWSVIDLQGTKGKVVTSTAETQDGVLWIGGLGLGRFHKGEVVWKTIPSFVPRNYM
jgi:streptogramin lyase